MLGAAAAQPAPSNPPVATQLLPEDSRLLIACEKILGVKFFHSRSLTSRPRHPDARITELYDRACVHREKVSRMRSDRLAIGLLLRNISPIIS